MTTTLISPFADLRGVGITDRRISRLLLLGDRILRAVGISTTSGERRRREALFLETIELHHDEIARICRSFASDYADLQDLMQDAMVNIWRGIETFRQKSELRTWIYRVTLNTCVSTFRKKPKATFMAIEDADCPVAAREEGYISSQWLKAALKTLSPIDHAIILMWLDELPYEEIAGVVGLQKATVATRIHRIKLKLKQIYQTNKF